MRSTTRRLTLQTLEDRRCPTGSIFQAGQTLIVRGDNSDNTIVIQDRGPVSQAPAGTTLTADITASDTDTTLHVQSPSGFPTFSPFIIEVDQEEMLVVGGFGTTTWNVERHFGGTSTSSHLSGAFVTLIPGITPATVTVTVDGQAQAFSNMKRVVVFGLGGNDSVSYLPDPAGGGTEGLTSLLVDLGAGNNVADFRVNRPTDTIPQGTFPAVGLNLQVFGGTGDDTLSVEVGELDAADVSVHARLGDGTNTFIGAVAGPLKSSSTKPLLPVNLLLFDVRGGAGTDSIDLEASGVRSDGYNVAAYLRGGAGGDDITADVELQGTVTSPVYLNLDGGAGDDALSATLDNETPAVDALIDTVRLQGGSGDDAMVVKRTTSNHFLALTTDGGEGTDSLIMFKHADLNRTDHLSWVSKAIELSLNFEF